jgi:hypothetical protein
MLRKTVHRVSLKTAEDKALPIILGGFLKRKSLRSPEETKQRDPVKTKRDARYNIKPEICPI